ncbi:hypothetical protein DsansV1_C16g0141321 [Dioscorea sansibarensis]
MDINCRFLQLGLNTNMTSLITRNGLQLTKNNITMTMVIVICAFLRECIHFSNKLQYLDKKKWIMLPTNSKMKVFFRCHAFVLLSLCMYIFNDIFLSEY